MESTLWSTLSNFGMTHLENEVFSNIETPKIYLCYADDFLLLNRTNELHNLQMTFWNNSELNFTKYE